MAKAKPASVDLNAPDNKMYIELESGKLVVHLRPDWAPKHVARIKELVREGFYDGLIFHRVIEGFMAQTGCPDGRGTGGTGKRIKAEFNAQNHDRGICSMARTMDINSADSQWFICLKNAHHLDGQYTAWGRVIEGMEHIDALPRGEPPAKPGKMLRVTLG